MIAIMKKTVYILCFLMILSAVIPAIAVSREILVQQEAEEIVRNSFNADYHYSKRQSKKDTIVQ